MIEPTPSLPPMIYEHVARKQWGRAILLHELPDRRTFLFEDGSERHIHANYYAKMGVVAIESEEAHRIDRLARRHQVPTAGSGKTKAALRKPPISFEQQVGHFLTLWPEGFEDPGFIKSERGKPGAKIAVKLKDKGIERAQEMLSQEVVDAAIAQNDYTAVFQAAHTVMSSTKGMATKMEITAFGNIPKSAHQKYALALQNLLYGEGNAHRHFDDYVHSVQVEGGPGWSLATMLPSLVQPTVHLFVKPTFLKKQALILDIDPRYDTKPNGTTYMLFQKAAQRTMERLQAASQTPRDLLDVFVFAYKTLSPKSIRAIQGIEV